MDNGYVYVLINPSMLNLVKIGKTTKSPEERAKELSTATGVPTPFIVVYQCYFESCSAAENFTHVYLESKGYRLSKNREFFEIPSPVAVEAVIQAKNHFGNFSKNDMIKDDFLNELDHVEQPSTPWNESWELAESYYFGLGDYLQDYEEGFNYAIQAAKLGCAKAYKLLGIFYKHGQVVKENKQKALQYFKQGADKGDIDCYAEMAMLFGDDHKDNATKCWNKYFELSSKTSSNDLSYANRYISEEAKIVGYHEALDLLGRGGEYFTSEIVSSNDFFLKLMTEIDDLELKTKNRAIFMQKLGFKMHKAMFINGKTRKIWIKGKDFTDEHIKSEMKKTYYNV